MKLSIAIPSKNRHRKLIELLDNVSKNISIPKEVIVSYADSDIETKKVLEENDWVTAVSDGNSGAVAAYNAAMKATTGEYVSYLTDDSRVVANTFETAIDYLDTHSEYVGVLFYHKDGDDPYHIHTIGAHIGNLKYEKGYKPFFMWGVLRNKVFREIGYWDEQFKSYYAAPDANVSLYEKGFDIIALPECKILHAPIVDALFRRNYSTYYADESKFIAKWRNVLK